MQIIIINLASETDRLTFQEKQFSALGLSFTLLPATSIKDISESTYEQLAYHWERPLRKAEVACFLSHKAAWESVLASNEVTLILEDDALLSTHIKTILQEIEVLENIDLISLEVRSRKKLVASTPCYTTELFKLFELYQDRTGAAGYVLWPTGAKKLLTKTKTLPAALADAFICSTYALKAQQIDPAAITQIDQIEKYNIPLATSSFSSISSSEKPPNTIPSSSNQYTSRLKFKFARLYSQLKMGVRHLSVLRKSKRRFIPLDPKHFNSE